MKLKKNKHIKIRKESTLPNTNPFKGFEPAKESDGFCICPKCFHLVFDEMLTGICPVCQYRFCAACTIRKQRI